MYVCAEISALFVSVFFNTPKKWRCILIAFKELDINKAIRDKEIRVVDADGSQLGIMSSADAQKLANDKDMDLVKIAPQAAPPVCRIMDYGKYRFEQQKREKDARKNQKIVEIKEIRLSARIDVGDFNTKLGHAQKFLHEGNKVKCSIRFRGREMAHTSRGTDTMVRFAEALEEYGAVENAPKLDGRSMQMVIAPKVSK